jgi:hypothetical protein
MLARQQYERELQEEGVGANTDDEDVLEVFDRNGTSMDVDGSSSAVKDKGKRKAEPNSMNSPTAVPSKRRRPLMDPFAASGQYSFVFKVDLTQFENRFCRQCRRGSVCSVFVVQKEIKVDQV